MRQFKFGLTRHTKLVICDHTISTNFPTVNAYKSLYGVGGGGNSTDAFVLELNASGSSLLYSTYLGGSDTDAAYGIALDNTNKIYITGYTINASSSFPITNAYQSSRRGGDEAFVSKLDPTISGTTGLLYSTFYGGTGDERGFGIAIGSDKSVYIAGYTSSSNITTTSGVAQTTSGGGEDGFVARLNPQVAPASQLVFATYLGGSQNDRGQGLALDSSGNAYITGYTYSANFITTTAVYQVGLGGGITNTTNADAFVTKLTTSGALSFSTYLGGSRDDRGAGIVVDSAGNIHILGATQVQGGLTTNDFITTTGALQTTWAGGVDAFYTKLNPSASSVLYSTYFGGSGSDEFIGNPQGIALDNSGGVYISGNTNSSNLITTTGAFSTTLAGGYDGWVAKFSDSSIVAVGGSNQSTITNTVFGNQLIAAVKDGAGNPISGASVTFAAPGSGASALFSNGTNTFSINTNSAGLAIAGVVTANTTTGTYTVTATTSGVGGSANFVLTNLSRVSTATLIALDGGGQSAIVNTNFTNLLRVKVLDSNGNGVPGVSVTFQAPSSMLGSKPTADFGTPVGGGGSSVTVTTDSSGIAASMSTQTGQMKAGSVVGNYVVTASASVITNSVSFALNNTPANDTFGYKLSLEPIVVGPNPLNTSQILTATLKKHDVTPISGQLVIFTVTGANARTVTTTTDSNGKATITYTGTVTGTDTITATASLNGGAISSNQSNIYWAQAPNTITNGPVLGRFFNHINYVEQINITSTALFTQTFPSLIFSPPVNSVTGAPSTVLQNGFNSYNFANPFTNVNVDQNGNFLGATVAQGNGYTISSDNPAIGGLQEYSAAFTSYLIVNTAGSITLHVYHYDYFQLGIGPNSAGQQPTSTYNISGCRSTTPFLNIPVVACRQGWDSDDVSVNFPAPGIYPLEAELSEDANADGSFGIFVNSNPMAPSATLTISPSATVTKTISQTATFTVTAKDERGLILANQSVQLNVQGANLQLITGNTDSSGVVTLTYTGKAVGLDQVKAVSWVKGLPIFSSEVPVNWNPDSGGGSGPVYNCNPTNNWLASPTNPSTLSGVVSVTLNTGVSLGSNSLVQLYPSGSPDYSRMITLTSLPGGSTVGQTIYTLDTTLYANGSYILRVVTGDQTSTCQSSLTLINIVGENKPGRVTFTVNDFTVPLAGLPIVIGRTYDSLERNQDGDFGNGWKLSIGNPKLEVNPAGDVTLTMLDGRRVKFGFTPTSPGGALGFLLIPTYTGEPGAYGTLSASQGGCGLVSPSGGGYVCFPGYWFKPTAYQYRDPYGRLYEIAAPTLNGSVSTPGKLLSITDLNGNKLTYDDGGVNGLGGIKVTGNQTIPSNSSCPITGYVICFDRVSSRITKITDTTGTIYQYAYAAITTTNYIPGDLITVTLPVLTTPITYTYFTAGIQQHLFKAAFDPRGNQQVVTDYDANGRLISVAQPINASTRYTTTYAYTLPTTTNPNSSTTITNPDVGGQHQIVVQSFDGYGKLITETMDVGIDPNTSQMVRRSSQNTYDSSHNITQTLLPKTSDGTPDINRAVKYEFNAQGYQTAVTNTVSIPTRTNYNPYGGPQNIIEPFGSGGTHTWGVGYDSNFLPTSVTDTIGTAGGYAFDSRGSVLSRSDGNSKSTLYTYDQYGNKVSEVDPLGNLNRYQYDTMGRMTQMTDAVGVV